MSTFLKLKIARINKLAYTRYKYTQVPNIVIMYLECRYSKIVHTRIRIREHNLYSHYLSKRKTFSSFFFHSFSARLSRVNFFALAYLDEPIGLRILKCEENFLEQKKWAVIWLRDAVRYMQSGWYRWNFKNKILYRLLNVCQW